MKGDSLQSKHSWLFGLCAPLLGAALFLAFLSWTRLQIYVKAHDPAEVMSLSTLYREGPKDNIQISLKDFHFGDQLSFHVNEKTGKWGRVCLAAFPKGGSESSKEPMVLVRTYEIEGTEGIAEFVRRSTVRGILLNGIEPVDDDQKTMATKYNRDQASYLPVLDGTRTVPSTVEVTLLLVGTGLCAVLGGIGLSERIATLKSDREIEPILSPSSARVGGAMALLLALIVSKFAIFDVLAAAHHNEPYIWWLPALSGLCPAGALMGLLSVLSGKALANFRDESGQLTTAGLAIVLVQGLVAMLFVVWFFHELHNLGYWHKQII